MEERFAGVELSSVEEQDQGELTGLTRNFDSLQVLGALAVVMSYYCRAQLQLQLKLQLS